MRTQRNVTTQRNLLKSSWGVENREDLRDAIDSIAIMVTAIALTSIQRCLNR